MSTIDRIRLNSLRFLIAYLWLHVPLLALGGIWFGVPWMSATIGAAVFAALTTALWRANPQGMPARMLASFSLMIMAMLLVDEYRGMALQIDLHLYFMAALAMLVTLVDWRAIVVAAAAVAIHHLALNFILPEMLWPGGADFSRVLTHAVIVVLETAALIYGAFHMEQAIENADGAVARATAAEAEATRLSHQRVEDERRASQERREERTRLADHFEAMVGRVVGSIGERSAEVKTTAEAMVASAHKTDDLAGSVANETNLASTSVQTVASAAEELSSSIGEIARQVARSTEIASEAVAEAEAADRTVQNLSESAQRISEVIELITSIAMQTNMLALNATIEAARAGEAGRGFAVVAAEVKTLANQTAQATEGISTQINAIQSVTEQTVGAIASIRGRISSISEMSQAIAAAVQEQNAATGEITRSTHVAAESTGEAARTVDTVRADTGETVRTAEAVAHSAAGLANEVATLGHEVRQFMGSIRSA